ncbi:MAG: hypothetical protein K0R02_1222 [Rickettsiaceae bacterium]|jgi:uncharacterized protein YbaR (Trm112 family)|nr:hypothetical protein [Rickettsiaceae bacterium]
MELSSELLKVLVCPVTKGPLVYDRQAQELVSEMAGLAYPVRDGIPILLADEARKINKNAFKPLPQKVDYITSAVTTEEASVEEVA